MLNDLNQKTKKVELKPFKASLPTLTPEQTITWLDGMRALMLEVWSKNPDQIPADKKKLLEVSQK